MHTLKIISKLLTILVFVLVLTSYNSASVNAKNPPTMSANKARVIVTQNDSLKAVVQFLLNASATDFHTHQPPVPVGFRNVKVGYLITANAEKQYVLCGQFLSQGKNERNKWTPFAIIKTSSYEQLIGGQALAFSQNPTVKWVKITNLSSVLKNRLDSLR